MKKPFKTYNGGKNGSGVYQQIINQIPPHKIFISGFAGNCGVLANKLPAPMANIAVDIDTAVTDRWKMIAGITTINSSSLPFLSNVIQFLQVSNPLLLDDIVIYLDPPYLSDVRSCKKPYYKKEMNDIASHKNMLMHIISWPVKVIVSHYPCDIYNTILNDWRIHDFKAMTRNGLRTERLYMNYPEPDQLHDYRYIGDDFRERELYKKMRTNMVNKFKRMSQLERNMVINLLHTADLIHNSGVSPQRK